MEDPEGECGTSCTLVMKSVECAKTFHATLLAEGVGACLLFHPHILDCAVYYHWDRYLISSLFSSAFPPSQTVSFL